MSSKQPLDLNQSIQLALQYHQSGRLQQAEEIYHEILAIDPDNVDANHFLGVIAHQAGDNDQAIQLIRKAIQCKPDVAAMHNNLGEVFRSMNRLDEAAACYQRTVALEPDLAEVHNNLGCVLRRLGRLELAVASFKKAVAIKPQYAEAHSNLGNVLKDLGQLHDAVASCTKALTIRSDYALALNNLGAALLRLGQLEEAVVSFNKAICIDPNYAEAHNNLGLALHDWGHLDDAVTSYRRAISIDPVDAGMYDLVGAFHSNLLLALNYLPDTSQARIYAESRQWHCQHAASLLPTAASYKNNRTSERKLRIGYISADFRSHSVACFFEPLLEKHDRTKMEIYCYSNVLKPDAVTQRLKSNSDHWRSIVSKSDQSAADQIRQDEIDILVDLAGHTENNRLLVLARKPAPVQVTWLGYPNTTGLKAIDYRFTDKITDPVGLSDHLHSEELIRLESGFLSYQGIESASVNSTLPLSERGHITFGSFNNLTKVVPEVVAVWIEILRLVPDAHLLLKSRQLSAGEVRARYLAMFREGQISSDRIELYGRTPSRLDHLQLYGKVDIGLDPFPYNGTTTTCEALWMGVPVITLLGDRHAGRVGASILTQLGLADLIAEDAKSYIDLAVGLAEETDKLAMLRRSLRGMMLQSELCNAADFARKIEDAYAVMWKKYLSKTQS